jgi:predicted ArsR family transcriptional regulator
VSDKAVSERLGLTVAEVRQHFEALKSANRIHLRMDSSGHHATRQALGSLFDLVRAQERGQPTSGREASTPVKQQILQTLLEAQGCSGSYIPAATIAEQLGREPDEVEGHLEILHDEGRVEVEWNSSGCFGHLTDAQKQRFKEFVMAIDGNEIRRRILQAIMEIQGNSNVYTGDSQIAERLGLSVEDVDGHLEILRDEEQLRFQRTSGGCSVFLSEGQKQRFKESLAAPRTISAATAVLAIPPDIMESLKQFRKDHHDPSKVAFIMMRFGSTAAHDEIVKGIRSALQPYNIEAVRADEKHYHDDLWPNVLTYIFGCGFGIAVFERLEQEDFNPNVSLEVGYLYGLGKPVCLLKDKTLKTLHTDLVGKLYRPFDPQNPTNSIPTELAKWMTDKGIIDSP